MRDFTDEQGEAWKAIAVDAVVAHGRAGAALAFAKGAGDTEPIVTSVTFNSRAAADFALRTIGVTELRRRLTLAKAAIVGI